MHMFHLGITQHIVQNILVKPGLLNPLQDAQPEAERPFPRFDALVSQTYWPTFCL